MHDILIRARELIADTTTHEDVLALFDKAIVA